MRESVQMKGAQVWLVTLCLGRVVPSPSFPLLSQMLVSQSTSLHARQAALPRHNKGYSLMGPAYMLHAYHNCASGLYSACEAQLIESMEREQGTSEIRFIGLCFTCCMGDTFIYEQAQGHAWTLTCVTSVSLVACHLSHAQFTLCSGGGAWQRGRTNSQISCRTGSGMYCATQPSLLIYAPPSSKKHQRSSSAIDALAWDWRTHAKIEKRCCSIDCTNRLRRAYLSTDRLRGKGREAVWSGSLQEAVQRHQPWRPTFSGVLFWATNGKCLPN